MQRLIAALNDRDVDRYLALCAPDVEMVSPVAALEGVGNGVEGIRQFFTQLNEAMSDFRRDVQRVEAIGPDRVIALMRLSAVSDRGVPFAQPVSSVYDLAGGKLRRVRVYLDPAEALEDVGLDE